jgi:hypothetical protein
VHQSSGLEGLARLFLGHLGGRELPQFIVHEGEELLGSLKRRLVRLRTGCG